MYTVYDHVSPSGKHYIGITSRRPEKRWGRNGCHYKNNQHFISAIMKYGWDNFQHNIIAENLTEEEACQMEIELINHYKSIGLTYNKNPGGLCSPELVREKISKKLQNKPTKVVSNETREKIRQSLLGRHVTPESDLKRSLTLKGHTTTTQCKALIALRNSGGRYIHKNGICKHINESDLQKYLDDGWKLRQIKNGDSFKNKMTGRVFINNGNIMKMVSKSELNDYINLGWSKGRLK